MFFKIFVYFTIFKHKIIGYNFMFTEMQAAIGNIQLKKLPAILERKRRIYRKDKQNPRNFVDF